MVTTACATAPAPPAVTGTWGGQHIALVATEAGGTLEYDCAVGTIDQPLTPDEAGRFQALGSHTFGHGGPVHQDEVPDTQPARYHGTLGGTEMTLSVTLTDGGQEIGTFTLVKDASPRIVRCL